MEDLVKRKNYHISALGSETCNNLLLLLSLNCPGECILMDTFSKWRMTTVTQWMNRNLYPGCFVSINPTEFVLDRKVILITYPMIKDKPSLSPPEEYFFIDLKALENDPIKLKLAMAVYTLVEKLQRTQHHQEEKYLKQLKALLVTVLNIDDLWPEFKTTPSYWKFFKIIEKTNPYIVISNTHEQMMILSPKIYILNVFRPESASADSVMEIIPDPYLSPKKSLLELYLIHKSKSLWRFVII